MPNQTDHQGLILAVDVKPRLRWTRQLHEQFVDAVTQLGGPEKATPKSVMQMMDVPGLTLYHLKSHLQKYRLAKNRDDHKKPNCMLDDEFKGRDDKSQPQLNEALLQHIQRDVRRKLQEQIEVQKHLQLRIEAQGRYLQSVLKKAQETLAGHDSTPPGTGAARIELSELVSAVEAECMSSSLTHGDFIFRRKQSADSSMDSSLTSSKNFELTEKDSGQRKLESSSISHPFSSRSAEIEELDLNK